MPVRRVQTAKIRYQPDTDRYRVSLAEAIRAASLDENAMFRYLFKESDDCGFVPALGAKENALFAGKRTYSVVKEGASNAGLADASRSA